jgi:hypothetical protein
MAPINTLQTLKPYQGMNFIALDKDKNIGQVRRDGNTLGNFIIIIPAAATMRNLNISSVL